MTLFLTVSAPAALAENDQDGPDLPDAASEVAVAAVADAQGGQDGEDSQPEGPELPEPAVGPEGELPEPAVGAEGDLPEPAVGPDGDGSDQDAENPGNRGNFKLSTVDGEEFPPDNEPHLPCVFEVNFYQYDVDAVRVSFDVQPPSGEFQHLRGPETVELPFPGDDQGLTFNGSSPTYDLRGDLQRVGAEPHDQQGYHIRISVTRVAEDPASESNVNPKQKVFWIDCQDVSAAAGEQEQAADLLVSKVVSGAAAPDEGTVFTFEVTCANRTVTVERTAGQSAWSWNASVDGDDLVSGDECSIVELSPNRGGDVEVRFNGTVVTEGQLVALRADDNRFRVHNRYGAAQAAELFVVKDVFGETEDEDFTVEVTCEGRTVEVGLTANGEAWSWTDEVGELSGGDTCSVVEVGDARGDVVEIRFSRAMSAENQDEDLRAGSNTFAVVNRYEDVQVAGEAAASEEQELDVAGEQVVAEEQQGGAEEELDVAGEQVVAGPEVVTAGPETEVRGVALEQRPAGAPETVPAEQGVAGQQVVAAQELPRTGVSSSALLLLAVGMLGIGGLAVRRTC